MTILQCLPTTKSYSAGAEFNNNNIQITSKRFIYGVNYSEWYYMAIKLEHQAQKNNTTSDSKANLP